MVEASSALCEHGNEPLGSIKEGEFLDWLSDCQLVKTVPREVSYLVS